MHILVMYSTHTPTLSHLEHLATLTPSTKVTVAQNEPMAIESAKDAHVILGHRYLRQCLPYAHQLRWVQTTAGGVDRLPWLELARRNVCLTRSTLSSPMIARHAVTLAWGLTRGLPQCVQQQSSGVWNQEINWLPLPRKAIIFGTGSIGCAIAQLLNHDGIEVFGVKKRPANKTIPGFADLFDLAAGLNMLSDMDWCFLALPYASETKDFFDEAAMRQLSNHAVLVNVGRGETLVTSDLCRVLNDGHLGGVALDVVVPKPKNNNDPIWKVPRLLLTPYVASHCRERANDIEQFCEEQVRRFIDQKPLLNVVDLIDLSKRLESD